MKKELKRDNPEGIYYDAVIERMRRHIKEEGMKITTNGDIKKLEAENAELKTRIKAMEEQEPVAWRHENRFDFDCIDDRTKDIWLSCTSSHVEHYTIPLYAAPTAAMLDKVRDEENEACASICDEHFSIEGIAQACAEAIRARRAK